MDRNQIVQPENIVCKKPTLMEADADERQQYALLPGLFAWRST